MAKIDKMRSCGQVVMFVIDVSCTINGLSVGCGINNSNTVVFFSS